MADVEFKLLFLWILQPVAVVLAPIPSILIVVKLPDNLTIAPGDSLPISTDSAVDVVWFEPLHNIAGILDLYKNVLDADPNVNRVLPAGLSTKVWSPFAPDIYIYIN